VYQNAAEICISTEVLRAVSSFSKVRLTAIVLVKEKDKKTRSSQFTLSWKHQLVNHRELSLFICRKRPSGFYYRKY